jgi:hypothetical protein
MNMPQSSLSSTTFKLITIDFLNPIDEEEQVFFFQKREVAEVLNERKEKKRLTI